MTTLLSDGRAPSLFDRFDPRLRCGGGVVLMTCTALSQSPRALFPLLAFGALCVVLFGVKRWAQGAKTLLYPTLFLILTLAFTYSVEGSAWWQPTAQGLVQGLWIGARAFGALAFALTLVVPLGLWNIEEVLERCGAGEKLRSLVILTVRYVFLLGERVSKGARVLALRGHGASTKVRLAAHGAFVGTTFIHCHDRALRGWQALALRGGLAGFRRRSPWKMGRHDWLALALLSFGLCLWGVMVWM